MGFNFEFTGGVFKPETHRVEKFLLFFVVGGNEIPLYQMLETGLVHREDFSGRYYTGNNLMKVFLLEQGFGVQKRFHSFYMRLVDGPYPEVTVLPFSGESSGYRFKGKVQFLSAKKVLQLLAEDSPSRRFVMEQRPLPKAVLREVIRVDRTAARDGVRHIRIGRKQNGGV